MREKKNCTSMMISPFLKTLCACVTYLYVCVCVCVCVCAAGNTGGFTVPLSSLVPGSNLIQILFVFAGQQRYLQNITIERTVPRKTTTTAELTVILCNPQMRTCMFIHWPLCTRSI